MRPQFINLLLGLLLTSQTVTAFTPSKSRCSNRNHTVAGGVQMSNDDNNIGTSIANGISKIFNGFSPLSEGKKKLVQSLAGDYDKSKIQNELQSLIQNEPVLFLSFTK
jgi:hypothetical protein